MKSIVFWVYVQTNLSWEKKVMSNDWIVLDLRKNVFMITNLTIMNLMTSASFEFLNNMTCRANNRLNENVESCSSTFLFFICLSIWKKNSMSEKLLVIIVCFFVKISCNLKVFRMMMRWVVTYFVFENRREFWWIKTWSKIIKS